MRTKQQTKGFTLIEISLVIVATALMIAGVLVGQTLIKSAGIRALVKQPSEMEAAINVFQEKYNCLPGDCKEAEELGLLNMDLLNGAVAGNGNGQIDSWEGLDASYQLGKKGLIKVGREERWSPHDVIFVEGNAVSSRGYRGVWAVSYMFYAGLNHVDSSPAINHDGHYYTAIEGELGLHGDIAPVLTPADSYAFDQKLDDGLPRSGRVLATSISSRSGYGNVGLIFKSHYSDQSTGLFPTPMFSEIESAGAAGAESNFCITNDTIKQYNIANESRRDGSLCSLIVEANF